MISTPSGKKKTVRPFDPEENNPFLVVSLIQA
jgi:hypothetical protein